ncbi:MAG TPA: diguanylate cyclase, partial [Solimonas sp.]|nr:diguanylate cyclase [Solimonas sp.]
MGDRGKRTELPFWLTVLVYALPLLAVVIGSLLFVRAMVDYGVGQEKQALTTVAVTAAASLDPAAVATLRGSAADIGTQAFRHTRARMARIRQVNPSLRFVYLMRRQQGRFVFLADAEPESSPDYSPPGQVYDEKIDGMLQVMETRWPLVEDAYQDSWGQWVSVLVPVLDPVNGRVIAIFGMDIGASSWSQTVSSYGAFAAAISALIGGIVVLFLLGHHRQRRHGERLADLNSALNAELIERQRAEARLSRMANLDGLTGIPNRRQFDTQLQQCWDRALRQRQPLSLLMADLDFFKRYNDRYGHLEGDDCLRRVARQLLALAQRPEELVARYGGEEFA